MTNHSMSRRALLGWIGKTAGAGAMYQAMTSLGFAAESSHPGSLNLDGVKKGATVLVLGAGVAGMTSAYELRKAGYKVKILEFNSRAGGRCWTLRGGDSYTELGGATQQCQFAEGNYINPGPWRVPYHHHHVMSYINEFNIAIEPFIQVNYNALVHSTKAFGGKPQRYRTVQADYQGYAAELLAKTINQNALDDSLSLEDREKLFESLRHWGALNEKGKYQKSHETSLRRGFAIPPGGGLSGKGEPSDLIDQSALLQSDLWKFIVNGQDIEFQSSIFQPVGGMDNIAKAFEKRVGDLIEYNARVTKIDQNDTGVTVDYEHHGVAKTAKADWCVCTIPLSILSQIPVKASSAMQTAIRSVPYASSVKVGLEFNRRFWEQDEAIFGGVSYTDLPITNISYPSAKYYDKGKGVLLGAYVWGPNAFEFTSLAPEERVKKAVEYGKQIHPQYTEEFNNGIAVGWHRVPWTQGCFGAWTEEKREQHYDNLCQVDGRLVLAGEHASHLPAWQEGAISSAHDAIKRLHKKAVATAA
ncbi:flavin monoamine oxidase family protein [Alteromonas confluentis]|nr:flavin monoamine oxidase family protein [Alteromonas confluentis]